MAFLPMLRAASVCLFIIDKLKAAQRPPSTFLRAIKELSINLKNQTMEKATKKSTGKKSAPASYTKEENASMLQDFFMDELRDIYWAEKHLVKALPKMEKAATSEELATAFSDHLAVTQEQVARLEQVFQLLGEKPRGKKCEAMEGLVKEAESVIEDTEEGTSTRDVGLIISAQKVEHYEIASYGGLTQLAKTLGKEDIANLLAETLEEEKETDELLTNLAENNINQSAQQEVEE
jgi:ferritin-like metal-binding protein YciE